MGVGALGWARVRMGIGALCGRLVDAARRFEEAFVDLHLVEGLGFGVWGSGLRVQGSGFRVWGLGFRAQGLGLRVWGLGFRV